MNVAFEYIICTDGQTENTFRREVDKSLQPELKTHYKQGQVIFLHERFEKRVHQSKHSGESAQKRETQKIKNRFLSRGFQRANTRTNYELQRTVRGKEKNKSRLEV